MHNLVGLLWSEWKDLEQQIHGMNEEIEQIASIHLRRPVNRLGFFLAVARRTIHSREFRIKFREPLVRRADRSAMRALLSL
jgi:hypothetical protein